MSQLVRMIYNSIVYLFVQKAEDLRYGCDEFLKNSPYLLGYRELYRLPGYFPEKTADGLIVAEAPCDGKDVVLDAAQGCGRNLGSETGTLAFAESKVGLAVLEHYLKSPSSGIYLPGLEEIQASVSREQSAPFAVLCAAYKKDSYSDSAEHGIIHDIAASEPTAVLLQAKFLAEPHKRRGREVAVSGMVSCLAVLPDLYHAEPVTPDMAAVDEADHLLASEPAVSKHITEPYAPADRPRNHLLGEVYLGHVIFLLALTQDSAVMLGYMAPVEFLRAQAVVALLSLLANDGEIKKELRHTVGDGHAEAFEPKHGLVGKVRVYTSDPLDCPASLLMVGVVKDQADIIALVVGTQVYTPPQLDRYVPQGLSPVYGRIFHKAVEHILACIYEGGQRAFLLVAPGIPYTEAWEEYKTLEHSQKTVHAVAFACERKRSVLAHPDLRQDRAYVLHCGCHIRFFEKNFDIREKWCNFVYRHGLEFIFLVVLKITQNLAFMQETMSFFYAIISENQYLRNLNY